MHGSAYGGIGGQGGNRDSTGTGGSSGGAGNPGGKGTSGNGYTGNAGDNGTGGLMMLYADTINNNGSIVSNGSNGGYGFFHSGSGSGGGSINIFYKSNIERGIITANGGVAGPIDSRGGHCQGGSGGNGSITIGNISTGTFVEDE